MIPTNELIKIATARLQDADVLFQGSRFDGAVYLCGYSVELALKPKICKTLKWTGFPSTNSEFQGFQSFKTHRLDILLSLSGQEIKIKTNHLTDWSIVANWDSETRYSVIGTATQTDAHNIIQSAKIIVKAFK